MRLLPPSLKIIFFYLTLKENQDRFLQDIKTWNVFGLDMHSLPEATDPGLGSSRLPQSLYRMAALFETFCCHFKNAALCLKLKAWQKPNVNSITFLNTFRTRSHEWLLVKLDAAAVHLI